MNQIVKKMSETIFSTLRLAYFPNNACHLFCYISNEAIITTRIRRMEKVMFYKCVSVNRVDTPWIAPRGTP